MPADGASPLIHVVCAVIQDDSGRYLATRRPVDKALGGLWEFPGGKVEPGEDPAAALRREIAEELGLAIVVGPALPVVIQRYAFGTIALQPFRCRPSGGTLVLHEHTAATWLPRTALWSLDWAPADIPVLARLGR
jgi:8-oxo-dGTP diphosphatase